jgi:hypothetical protein
MQLRRKAKPLGWAILLIGLAARLKPDLFGPLADEVEKIGLGNVAFVLVGVLIVALSVEPGRFHEWRALLIKGPALHASLQEPLIVAAQDADLREPRLEGRRLRLVGLKVGNRGDIASECRARVVALQEWDGRRWGASPLLEPDMVKRPQLLKWKEAENGITHVERKIPRHLDLCCAIEGEAVLFLAPPHWPPQADPIKLERGKYRVQVRIGPAASADSAEIDRSFEIEHLGDWDTWAVDKKGRTL